jgi:hypothetical protein
LAGGIRIRAYVRSGVFSASTQLQIVSSLVPYSIYGKYDQQTILSFEFASDSCHHWYAYCVAKVHEQWILYVLRVHEKRLFDLVDVSDETAFGISLAFGRKPSPAKPDFSLC